MGSASDDKRPQNLSDMCTDLFSFILSLRVSHDLERSHVIHDRAISLFTSIEEKARESRIPDADVQDAKYTLVAFVDETMEWASRLEQEFFRGNIAGEEFFRRLEQIKESEDRTGVLKIYYMCLVLGFEGKYFRTPEKLEEYIGELSQILGLKGAEKLSQSGEAPKEAMPSRSHGIPAWVPWIFAGAGIVIVLIAFAIFRMRISDWTGIAVSRIQSLIGM
jgi:type VI secretion system protein ImpK